MTKEAPKVLSAEKEFGNFKDHFDLDNADVKLYRSSNKKDTAVYFTENEQVGSAYFELLILEDPLQHLFLRYPNTNHFIRLSWSHSSSSRGKMKHCKSAINIWADEYKASISFYEHEPDLLLLIGEVLPEFNFMELVDAHISLKLPFIRLPNSVRRIEYIRKDAATNTFYIVDLPAFNFNYSNFRVRSFNDKNGEVEFALKNVSRMRDGGTTAIEVIDAVGNPHTLFCPQRSLPTATHKDCTWDETKLEEEISVEERQYLITALKINEIPAHLKNIY